MRVLVTWGSKTGGTEGIAWILSDELRRSGLDVDVLPPREASRATSFDAAVIGGALYANRWHRDARRFVERREQELRRVPVWFFSSGPRDDSADRGAIPPTRQVSALMERVGALGHVTFGGWSVANKRAGDWRNPERIRAWASDIARALPTARPGIVGAQPGRSLARLFRHGLAGWALCALAMVFLLAVTTRGAALVLHALLVPIAFVFVARHYFRGRGARDPLPTALAFAGLFAVLDLAVAWLAEGSLAALASVAGVWLPLALIFLATLATVSTIAMIR